MVDWWEVAEAVIGGIGVALIVGLCRVLVLLSRSIEQVRSELLGELQAIRQEISEWKVAESDRFGAMLAAVERCRVALEEHEDRNRDEFSAVRRELGLLWRRGASRASDS